MSNPIKLFVSPLMAGLLDHRVSAQVRDLDHYRIHGGMAVETDYIIQVRCVANAKKRRPEPDFENFTLSKTFSAFRTLVDQLHASADAVMTKGGDLPPKVEQLANYCEMVLHLVESQRTQYLGKVNYMYVKILSKQRSQIIIDVLETTLSHFPDETESHPFLAEIADKIEAFFLTDHCESIDDSGKEEAISLFVTPVKKNYKNVINRILPSNTKKKPSSPDSQDSGIVDETPPVPGLKGNISSPVVPYTRKSRRSIHIRASDEKELLAAGGRASLLVDDDRGHADLVPSYEAPMPTVASRGTNKVGTFIDNNPFMFLFIFVAAMQILRVAGNMVITVDLDIVLLLLFALFCLGLHTPRPMIGGIDTAPLRRSRAKYRGGDVTPVKLLKKSMAAQTAKNKGVEVGARMERDMEDETDGTEDHFISPMEKFPEDAEIGSVLNCWSEPPCERFNVRGDNYLSDRKKVPSGPFLFPARGMDLFLTDTSPENVGRITSIMGGRLREVPTFILNFRLPWGVLIAYYEIPERFLPYVNAGYDLSVDRKPFEKEIKKMNNQDRCCARWLMGDKKHKDQTLKIFPGVVQGPWVVKSVIGGKPAIIGTKLPVHYVYAPGGKAADGTKQALYLEADLDIVSSSAARGILSVARTYVQELTLDLGFGIQGNSKDELREQMLTGLRLHGLDPMSAPPLPPVKDMLYMTDTQSHGDDGSVTEHG